MQPAPLHVSRRRFVIVTSASLFALVGCMNGGEMQANIDALDIALTPAEVAYLDLKADAPK